MFNLELDKVINKITEKNSKNVLIQLPDGLKPRANEVVEAIETKTKAKAFIWLGSCFGACDIPIGMNSIGIDLVIQFGHNPYHKTIKQW